MWKVMRGILLLSWLALVGFGVKGCLLQQGSMVHVRDVIMHIPLHIQLPGPLSQDKLARIDTLIADLFGQIDTIYNPWNLDSEISRINLAPAWTPLLLSEPLAHFLVEVQKLVTLTDGRFDPTIAPVHQVWLQALNEGHMPDTTTLEAVMPAVGWHHICLTGRLLYKTHPKTAIDLCGIVKGFAVDELVLALEHLGYRNLYVDWGGEIAVRGHHPSGRPWRIKLETTTIDLEPHDMAVATSGTCHQQWIVDDRAFSHIVHPHTLTPLMSTTILSASVLSSRCMTADALATTLMLFDTPDHASRWFDTHITEGQAWVVAR